jgi:GT2 family glycosyltransferase
MKKLVILTLTWNAKEKLQALYDSILPALEGIDWRWGIKDNGSNDNTVEMVESWKNDRVTVFAYKNNLQNYSQGNNWLCQQMAPEEGDYILMLNNDIVFKDSESIKKMISIIDNDNSVGVVGCKLNYEDDPTKVQHVGVLFHPGNIGTPFHFRAGAKEEHRDRLNRLYPIVTGAVILTPFDLFKEIGGLNEKLHWCWDDSFYCMEVQNKNKKVVYCGETNILHAESASLKKNPVNKLYFKQNLQIFIDRWKNKIDKELVQKYDKDPNFMLYRQ